MITTQFWKRKFNRTKTRTNAFAKREKKMPLNCLKIMSLSACFTQYDLVSQWHCRLDMREPRKGGAEESLTTTVTNIRGDLDQAYDEGSSNRGLK